jgi:arsenate reductase (thioredoxin)
MKRFHVHVAVDDLKRSIGFYSALFAAQPSVIKTDYAKWMLDDPRVNFAISTRGREPGLDHLGIQAESGDELKEIYARLHEADGNVVEQGETSCCYAKSEKSWIDDPAGISWETFQRAAKASIMATALASALREWPTRSRVARQFQNPPRRAAVRRDMAEPYNVLFLCTGNSARSIMAEAILNKVGAGKFRAYSAGSQPRGQLHPETIRLLQGLGHDTSDFRSKSWSEFAKSGAPSLDFVFTVCDNAAGETCPIWPGQPMTAHWGVPDPAQAKGREAEVALAFKDAYRMLNRRIGIFSALPIRSLDQLTLQKKLKEIGRT